MVATTPLWLSRSLIVIGIVSIIASSREAIGQSDGCLVVTGAPLAIESPTAQAIEWFTGFLGASCGEQRRSSTMHEQRAQIDVTAFGDAPKPAALGAGSFARG